ncbi:MAG: hypothetical protein HYY46_11905 [Deltaproteobacteria bacterium]|nr:hypothetical protein [Deltaproteobacteria bacterium]
MKSDFISQQHQSEAADRLVTAVQDLAQQFERHQAHMTTHGCVRCCEFFKTSAEAALAFVNALGDLAVCQQRILH